MPNHPKKTLILNILDILCRYTDEDHRLSQKEIAEILRTEYGMEAERKTIRRHLLNLIDCGYEIEYSESVRMVPNPKTGVPEESYLWSDFYLVRDFTDAELRLLIDGVLSSKHITASYSKDLIERLSRLSNKFFRSHIKHVYSVNDWSKTDNMAVFLNIELIDEAIEKGLQIQFEYNKYGVDNNHTPRSAGSNEYHRATGLETLFGWLYVSNQEARAKQLFELCFPAETEETK